MNKINISLFLLLFAGLGFAQAQTVDEVIDRHIEAIGGKAKLAELKSIRMETNLSVQGMDIPVVTTRVHNVGQRIDISAMGMEGFMITTPTQGWVYMPFMGQAAAEAMPEQQVKDGAEELDLQGRFCNYKDKGIAVELAGKENVDGKEAYKLNVTSKSGRSTTIYIDAKDYYIVQSVAKAFVMGQEQEVTIKYADYRKTEEGYVFPYSVSGAFGQGDMTVTKIEVNKAVDEKIFKPAN